jgi:hypothetical protein
VREVENQTRIWRGGERENERNEKGRKRGREEW